MNQAQPAPAAPTPQPTQNPAPQATPNPASPPIGDPKKVKKIIITATIVVILILSTIIGLNYYKNWKIQDRENKDQQTIDLIYELRKQADTFYAKNNSYKDWWPASAIMKQATTIDSTIMVRKPDFQSYIMYAWLESDQKYFCIDTAKFADMVDKITDEQIKCN